MSESCSVMSDSLWPHRLYYSPWNSPGQNTEVGSHSLLQEFFPTQGLNPGLLHCRQILYQLSYQGSGEIVNINTSLWTELLTFCCLQTIDAWVSCPGNLHFKGPKKKELAGVILTCLWVPELGNWDHTPPHSHSQDTQVCLKVIICTRGDILPSHCWNYEMGNFRSYFATLGS